MKRRKKYQILAVVLMVALAGCVGSLSPDMTAPPGEVNETVLNESDYSIYDQEEVGFNETISSNGSNNGEIVISSWTTTYENEDEIIDEIDNEFAVGTYIVQSYPSIKYFDVELNPIIRGGDSTELFKEAADDSDELNITDTKDSYDVYNEYIEEDIEVTKLKGEFNVEEISEPFNATILGADYNYNDTAVVMYGAYIDGYDDEKEELIEFIKNTELNYEKEGKHNIQMEE